MVNDENEYTQMQVTRKNRDRLERMKQLVVANTKRRIERLDEVLTRVLDFYEENYTKE